MNKPATFSNVQLEMVQPPGAPRAETVRLHTLIDTGELRRLLSQVAMVELLKMILADVAEPRASLRQP